MQTYEEFVESKLHLSGNFGFKPTSLPDQLFDFQKSLVEWAIRKGRAAIFADCGLGKSFMQLVWADNVARHTNKPVLILTPLAVGHQTVKEGKTFGIECKRSPDGKVDSKIIVTNYERLHYFNPSDFSGVVCDESSILKSFDGKIKAAITEFMRTLPYRLLCTATAAPNDYVELGSSAEALGEMGFQDMITKFFKKENGGHHGWGNRNFYRFRGHAERDFWRWICSWARACRKPSDLGFDDTRFKLPPLITKEHVVSATTKREGWLFDVPAITLEEQREERRRTLSDRCNRVAELVEKVTGPSVIWCHLNDEGDLLERLIPDAVQVSGSDTDEKKEEYFTAFESGQIKRLVTKPTIAGWGLNWQHCSHQTFFPSHSFEQWYQAIRRCWRFGQKNSVAVDIVCSEGEMGVLANLQRKADAAEAMFQNLVDLMNSELRVSVSREFNKKELVPSWV